MGGPRHGEANKIAENVAILAPRSLTLHCEERFSAHARAQRSGRTNAIGDRSGSVCHRCRGACTLLRVRRPHQLPGKGQHTKSREKPEHDQNGRGFRHGRRNGEEKVHGYRQEVDGPAAVHCVALRVSSQSGHRQFHQLAFRHRSEEQRSQPEADDENAHAGKPTSNQLRSRLQSSTSRTRG